MRTWDRCLRALAVVLLAGLTAACGSRSLVVVPKDGAAEDAVVERATDLADATNDRPDAAEGPPGVDRPKELDATDATPDAAMSDADARPPFPFFLYDSLWIIGWSGDLEHLSWVRFTPTGDGTRGTWTTAPVVCSACMSYFLTDSGRPCIDGSSFGSRQPDLISLRRPDPCSKIVGGPGNNESLFFGKALPPSQPRALEDVEASSSLAKPVFRAHRYAPDTCGPDLTTCPNPFAP